MTSALIPPVIPRRSPPGNWPRGRPGAAGPLPLAASPGQAPALAADVVYGLGRIDASGRVADRTVTRALGWHGGDRLTLTASAGVVTARRDPDGLAILPPRHCIAIPRPCGIAAGCSPETWSCWQSSMPPTGSGVDNQGQDAVIPPAPATCAAT